MENLNYLKIGLIQTALYWESKSKNLALFEQLFRRLQFDTKLVILPEMFTTGFTMRSEKLAEDMEGHTMQWMATQSEKLNKTLVGSFIAKEDGMYYNRLVWMNPDNTYYTYDKKHLFRMAGEQNHFTAGDNHLVVDFHGWKICPMICYDLRFPVWCRNSKKYDMLIFIANWPNKRINHWNTLLQARAIENQAYVVGVNRVGRDGNGFLYNGYSQIVSHNGQVLTCEQDTDALIEFTINKQMMDDYRTQFPAWMDRDEFELI